MSPILSSNLPSEIKKLECNAYIPICDIIAGSKRKWNNDGKEVETEGSDSDEEVEAPKVVKKKLVKIISESEDEDKENSDNEKVDDSDYEFKKVKTIKEGIFSENEYAGLSYEKMVKKKRAETFAFLKSMEIDQIKSDISEALSSIKQIKKKTISRSYKIVQPPPSIEPVRRSKRLANIAIDFSEDALQKLAVKNGFQVPEVESIPSYTTFKDTLKSASPYEECISDLSVKGPKFWKKCISYDKVVLENMIINEFNVCKVVPARITSEAWYPSKQDLIVAAGDKYGSLGLWKIQDSETNPYLFKVHSSNIPHMEFCPFNPVQLYTASYEGIMRCGDLVKHAFNEIYVSDTSRCTWFDFLSPTTFLVSHSDGQVALVDRKTKGKNSEKRHACHDFTIKTICVHPVNKNVFVTADNKKTIRLWDLRKLQEKPVVEVLHHKKTVNSAYFSPVTGNSILTTSLDDSICIFDSTNLTGDIKLKSMIKHNNCSGQWLSIFRATWLPNSDDMFAVGCMEQPRKVQIFDKCLNQYHDMVNDNLTTITSVHRFHPYRSALAAGNSCGKLFVFT